MVRSARNPASFLDPARGIVMPWALAFATALILWGIIAILIGLVVTVEYNTVLFNSAAVIAMASGVIILATIGKIK